MITLAVRVTTSISREPITHLGNEVASWEGVQRVNTSIVKPKKDRFRVLNPDGPAQVAVAVSETLSGPPGTYSSVSVRIEVTARCDQNQESIDKARDILFNEGVQALEHYMGPALDLLNRHLT